MITVLELMLTTELLPYTVKSPYNTVLPFTDNVFSSVLPLALMLLAVIAEAEILPITSSVLFPNNVDDPIVTFELNAAAPPLVNLILVPRKSTVPSELNLFQCSLFPSPPSITFGANINVWFGEFDASIVGLLFE